jgi:hypothetical protein
MAKPAFYAGMAAGTLATTAAKAAPARMQRYGDRTQIAFTFRKLNGNALNGNRIEPMTHYMRAGNL